MCVQKHVDELTTEECLAWLKLNDPGYNWELAVPEDLVLCVKDNLKEFGDTIQVGDLYVHFNHSGWISSVTDEDMDGVVLIGTNKVFILDYGTLLDLSVDEPVPCWLSDNGLNRVRSESGCLVTAFPGNYIV